MWLCVSYCTEYQWLLWEVVRIALSIVYYCLWQLHRSSCDDTLAYICIVTFWTLVSDIYTVCKTVWLCVRTCGCTCLSLSLCVWLGVHTCVPFVCSPGCVLSRDATWSGICSMCGTITIIRTYSTILYTSLFPTHQINLCNVSCSVQQSQQVIHIAVQVLSKEACCSNS